MSQHPPFQRFIVVLSVVASSAAAPHPRVANRVHLRLRQHDLDCNVCLRVCILQLAGLRTLHCLKYFGTMSPSQLTYAHPCMYSYDQVADANDLPKGMGSHINPTRGNTGGPAEILVG